MAQKRLQDTPPVRDRSPAPVGDAAVDRDRMDSGYSDRQASARLTSNEGARR